MERDGKTSYYLCDGHGNVRALVDEEGKITDSYSYDAYGNLLQAEGETKNDFLYTGEQYNATTGLYYLRARYMNPSTGTFISMDSYKGNTYDPVSLHKYLYANANPVMNSDPTGFFSLGELVTCTSISDVFRHSAGFIALNALRGAIAGAVIGAADSILGGNEWSEVWKDALLGAASGAGIGVLISALACLGVIYPAAITALSIFRGIFLVSGGIATYISYNEGNIFQAVFRGILAIFCYKNMGKTIDGIKLYNVSHIEYVKSNIGPDFKPNGSLVQEGINPNSLKPSKDLGSLDPIRMEDAIKYAGDKPIIVDPNGYVLDGHHRLRFAIEQNKPVDVTIGY